MNQIVNTNEAGAAQADTAARYAKVAPDIAALSKEELAILMHGLYCKVLLVEREWKSRPNLLPDATASQTEVPAISRLFAAMRDYSVLAYVASSPPCAITAYWPTSPLRRHARLQRTGLRRLFAAMRDYSVLAYVDDAMLTINSKRHGPRSHGYVYVAAFADGHTKIGFSTDPAARIRSIAGANQSALLRSWISNPSPHSQRLERLAHKEFAAQRKGGEFFATPFQDAVTWIESELAKHQLAT